MRTLRRGFELGVNWVHSAPDYSGVEPWIARAIDESRCHVKVLAQGPGPLALLEPYFENTCRQFRSARLDLYGIGCIDDAERIGENVWGAGGMVEFLLRKKAEGRLGGLFCSTHGSPEYVEKLITSGVFDAIMLAYNPLGFHLLTYYAAKEGRDFERIAEHRGRLFPLAAQQGVSILVMKALGGGLSVPGRAMPPHAWFGGPAGPTPVADLLRYALAEPGVCAVVPGVASPEEAEENALAGHAPLALSVDTRATIERTAATMRLSLCSRCGDCESTCSRALPISSMFRDVYIWNYRTETFMADDRYNYFHLHPDQTLACATCTNQTCQCPQGLVVPVELARIHGHVQQLVEAHRHPGPVDRLRDRLVTGAHRVLVLADDVPSAMSPGEAGVARFVVENAGDEMWTAFSHIPDRHLAVGVAVLINGDLVVRRPLRQNVSPRERSSIVVEFTAPDRPGQYDLRIALLPLSATNATTGATPFHAATLTVRGVAASSWFDRLRPTPAAPAVVSSLDAPAGDPPAERHYGARYLEHTISPRVAADETQGVRVAIENTSDFAWLADPPDGHSIDVVVFVDDEVYSVLKLPRSEVPVGGIVTLHFALRAPATSGDHRVRIEVVHQQVAWFANRGVAPLMVDIVVAASEATATSRAFALALRHNVWHYQPTQGIARSRDGQPFPLFISRAKGCQLWDTDGHEYLDYTMSWGATILGHADDRVQAAIRDVLDSGPLPPFPHPCEMDVSRMVTEDFPCGDMVVFGKNGSDVCTVAARLARDRGGPSMHHPQAFRSVLRCTTHPV